MSEVWAVLSWWIILQALGLAAWPLAFRLLRWLPDRGYTLAKPIGLLIVSYLFWLLVSLHLLPNTVASVLVVFVILVGGSGWAYRREKTSLLHWLRDRRWLILSYELLFALAFIGWAIFRAHAPDIITGEKPMELAFLNAINRSSTFPPHDPWLSGFNIAYYYFGYVMLSLFQRLSSVNAGVAFSLGNALWFALSAASAFGVAANLVGLTKRSTPRAAVSTGVLAAIFVVLLGNFEAPLEVAYSAGQGSPEVWQQLDILDLNQPATPRESFPWPLRDDPGWWYRAAWLIHDYPPDTISPPLALVTGQPPDPNTISQATITEFPQFSFVLGDLHPHTLDLPFVLVSIALALNLFQAGASGKARSIMRTPAGLLYPVLLGGLGFMNAWDFPIYLALVIVALGLGRWLSHTTTSILPEIRDRVIDLLLVGGLGLALYLPFYSSFTSQVAGLWPNVFNGTRFVQFFILFGPFILIGVLLGWHVLRQQPLQRAAVAKGLVGGTLGVIGVSVIGAALIGAVFYQASPTLRTWFAGVLTAMQQRGITLDAQLLARVIDPWVPLTLALGLSAIGLVWLATRRAIPQEEAAQSKDFVLLLYGLGLLLALTVETVFIVDVFFTRKNTMFKFDYQAWILWSVASAYAAYYLLSHSSRAWRWMAALVIAGSIGLGLIYPALAIATRVTDSSIPAPTLDAFQAVAQSPRYPNADDAYAVMQWLNQNAAGSPVILEATDDESENKPARSRISSWTGLPTVLGWYGHETQWRGSDVVQRQRLPDITAIYSTTDEDTARSLLQRYTVAYVLVGDRERKQYPAEGLAKFDRMFPIAFQHGTITLYRME